MSLLMYINNTVKKIPLILLGNTFFSIFCDFWLISFKKEIKRYTTWPYLVNFKIFPFRAMAKKVCWAYGDHKKNAQQIRRGKKQFWALLYPIIQKIKKNPIWTSCRGRPVWPPDHIVVCCPSLTVTATRATKSVTVYLKIPTKKYKP